MRFPLRRIAHTGLVLIITLTLITATPAAVYAYSLNQSTEPALQPNTASNPSSSLQPLSQKQAALNILQTLDIKSRHSKQKNLDEAVHLLNSTFESYRGPTRVSSDDVFHTDAEVLRILARLDKQTSSDQVENTSMLVVEADNATAAQAIADANRAYNRYADRIETPGQRRSAKRLITNAEQAFDRAQKTRSRANNESSTRAIRTRAQALKQLATAWRHAQHAIDRLDANTSPQVWITYREDPLWKDSGTNQRVIVGNVSDVQAYELENLTVKFDGNQSKTVELNTSTQPATNASFATALTLDERITNVTVKVTDVPETGSVMESEDETWGKGTSRNSNGNGPGNKNSGNAGPSDRNQRKSPNGNGPSTHVEGEKSFGSKHNNKQIATATVHYDGDGLTDRYEENVAETSPVDFDSDSGLTSADEANNGTVDGGEDLDGDNVPLALEADYGTSPTSVDTDGDGLDDAFEIWYGRQGPLNATIVDTDGDGIPDNKEDPDNDTLTNEREESLETNPFSADTDGDSLTDGEEVKEYNTDPTLEDTDRDGLTDAEEIEIGTDPLVADSDGDGIIDGNETHSTTTIDNKTGTRVTVNATGYNGVSIQNISIEEDTETIRASPLVRIRGSDSFDQATVTIPYESGINTSSTNLSIATWSPRSNETWHLVNSTVDQTNGTVSATVPHFSYFMVVDGDLWRDFSRFSQSGSGDDSSDSQTPLDIVISLDTSGSMGGNKLDQAQIASQNFVGRLVGEDRAGLVGFTSFANVEQELTTNYDAVNQSIEQLYAGGGTDIADGLDTSVGHIQSRSPAEHDEVIVLVSDGRSWNRPALDAAERAAANDITVYTVAVGGGADRELLREIATITGGESYFVEDASDTDIAFRQISDDTSGRVDSDGDGLPDNYETSETPLLAGPNPFETVVTDPESKHSDEDGIPDGEEMELIEVRGALIPVNVQSNPSETNSDNTGGDDAAELEGPNPSNPLLREWFMMGAAIPSVSNSNNNPITAGEADGVANYDDDLVGVSSKSVSGSRFCIKEFDGCPKPWLEGVDRESDHSYYKIPIQVYATSNANLRAPIHWELEFNDDSGVGTVVATGSTSGTIEPGEGADRTYVTIELCGGQSISNALSCRRGAYQAAFERIGTLEVTFSNLDSTRFDEEGDQRTFSRSYSISRSFTLTAVTDMLDRTKQVYGYGMGIAGGATSVVSLRAAGASGTRIAIAVFRTGVGFAGIPTSPEGLVNRGISEGISAFETYVGITRTANREEIFGEDYRNQPAGPVEVQVT